MLGNDIIHPTTRNSQFRGKIRQYIRPPVTIPWTASEEALFLSFGKTHVPGTPWPIEAMGFFYRKNDSDCRRWTQESLDPKILADRANLRRILKSRRYGILITSP